MSMQMLFIPGSASGLDELKSLYLAFRKRRLEPSMVRLLLRILRHPRSVVAPAWHYSVRGRSYVPNAEIRVGIACEQEPSPESRILLGSRLDALGMPRADVRWKLTDLTLRSIKAFAGVLAEELPRAGVGALNLEPWLSADDQSDWTAHVTDQFHHMGTARMHQSPREGVTNPDCQVHGIGNLFLAGSSVFPTGGHSNPTLTLIALSLRLADKLARDLSPAVPGLRTSAGEAKSNTSS